MRVSSRLKILSREKGPLGIQIAFQKRKFKRLIRQQGLSTKPRLLRRGITSTEVLGSLGCATLLGLSILYLNTFRLPLLAFSKIGGIAIFTALFFIIAIEVIRFFLRTRFFKAIDQMDHYIQKKEPLDIFPLVERNHVQEMKYQRAGFYSAKTSYKIFFFFLDRYYFWSPLIIIFEKFD